MLADDALLARLDRAPLAFTLVGADRLTAAPAPDGGGAVARDGEDGGSTIDPSTATAALAGRTGEAAFLVAASPVRDHPYNLARRIASVAHLSRGRTGLAVGGADPYVAEGAGRSHGGGPVLTAPPGTAATFDLALAVQKLEQTWPWDTIVADREQRIFARGDRIRRADHEGVFTTAGPLTLPSSPEGASVVAWRVAARDELDAAAEVADLVIVPPGDGWVADARAALDTAPRGHFTDPERRPLLFAETEAGPGTEAAGLRERIAASGADGVVLRPVGADLAEVLDLVSGVAAALGAGAASDAASDVVSGSGGDGDGDRPAAPSLRARLGLPRTADLLPEGPGVFPEPVPRH